jgi:hypothetical protein
VHGAGVLPGRRIEQPRLSARRSNDRLPRLRFSDLRFSDVTVPMKRIERLGRCDEE